MTFHHQDSKPMFIMGGSLFYLIYKEAKALNLFTSKDSKVINNYLKYKTVDIDSFAFYKISDGSETNINIKELYGAESEKFESVLEKLSLKYLTLIAEKIPIILEQDKILNNNLSILADKMNLKGLDFKNNGILKEKVDTKGVFSVSIENNFKDVYELRPQINTCIDNLDNCDHIIEILTKPYEFSGENAYTDNVYYKFQNKQFFGENIIEMCTTNLDRIYQHQHHKSYGNFTKLNKGNIKIMLNKAFKKKPILKTKYIQGFYRVYMIYTLYKNILNSPSSKTQHLLDILFFKAHENVRKMKIMFNNKFFITLCDKTVYKKNLDIISKIFLKKNDITVGDVFTCLESCVNLWIASHNELLTDLDDDKELVLELKYNSPPAFTLSKSNIELPEDWETTYSNNEIKKLYNDLFAKPIIINSVTKKAAIKKIKKALELE